MEVPSPPSAVEEAASTHQDIGVWLVQNGLEAAEPWESLLAAAGSVCACPLLLRGRIAPDAASLAALRPGAGEVLIVTGNVPWDDAWLQAARASGKGLVMVCTSSPLPEARIADVAVVFVPAHPSAEVLALALLSAEAAARREERLRNECVQLQQRLQDRILLDRAKGLLVQRLNISEEEAYRRLRTAARRQRRALRDVARAILDTESLLDEPAPSSAGVEEANS